MASRKNDELGSPEFLRRRLLARERRLMLPPLTESERLYYKLLSAKGKKVIWEKKATGEQMHLAPLGYKNARDKDGRSIIVEDPKVYPLVQEARRLRAEGKSIRQICQVMEATGLRSQRGKKIGPSSMLKILRLSR